MYVSWMFPSQAKVLNTVAGLLNKENYETHSEPPCGPAAGSHALVAAAWVRFLFRELTKPLKC